MKPVLNHSCFMCVASSQPSLLIPLLLGDSLSIQLCFLENHHLIIARLLSKMGKNRDGEGGGGHSGLFFQSCPLIESQ